MSYRAKMNLSGRLALVTGAGQGIGAACAEALAQTGATVICTDIDLTRAEETARAIGGTASARQLNVTNSSELNKLASELTPLDILVCNAGIVNNIAAEDMTDDQWDRVIEVNLSGVFRTCRAFGRRMLENGTGSIVNIGSMSGNIVNVPQPQCHYNASKAGVHQLTRSLAVEWAKRGVRVNAIAPTYIETSLLHGLENQRGLVERWLDLTPMGRMGKPEEIASIVQFLASDASSLMTGSIITADAGYSSI